MTGTGRLGALEMLEVFTALLAVTWLALAVGLALRRRHAPVLEDSAAAPALTTILLPVRDEEANLAACAATLIAQGGAPLLRIIDDGSTDRTPEILAGIARDEPRVTPLTARQLAAGWGGKVNALATGFAGVATPWLLLTDADTRHQPELLARAHAAATEHRLDALSLSGQQQTVGLGESLLTPAAYALLDLMLGDWRPQARGEGASAVANGQYFLLRTDALRTIGGFEAISGDALDDVALARALRAGGFRVGFRRAGPALQVRMYDGGAATFRGWRRNFALFVATRPAVALAAIALTGATTGAMLLALATRSPATFAACWLAGAAASATIRKSSGNNPLTGALFPLDVLLLAATLTLAMIDRRRGRAASWRGREIEIQR